MTGLSWRKSSHSFSNGNCAEVAAWRVSTACAAGECAEVATSGAGILVRDSQLAGASPVLRFSTGEWAAFLAAVRQRQGIQDRGGA